MDWTALRVSLWLGAGTIALLLPFGIWFGRLLAVREFPRQAAGRSARHRAARAAADGARVLPARHLRRALSARPGVPGDRRAVAAVLLRGPAARLGDRQHPVRRPADSARLRGDPGRRARCGRLLRPDAVAAFRAHRAAARLAEHPDRGHPDLCAHARRVRRRADGGRQPPGRDADAQRGHLRSHAGVRRSQRRRHGRDAAGRLRSRR